MTVDQGGDGNVTPAAGDSEVAAAVNPQESGDEIQGDTMDVDESENVNVTLPIREDPGATAASASDSVPGQAQPPTQPVMIPAAPGTTDEETSDMD